MSKHRRTLRIGFLVVLAAYVPRGLGQAPPAAADDAARIEQLRFLLEQQQETVADLERSLAAYRSDDVDQQRTEAMRQQIREILGEAEFRESLMPSVSMAGYDGGFYIKSSDDQFLMKFNGLMQLRWTHYGTQSRNRYLLPRLERDDRTGFDFNRLRLWMSGNAWSPDLTYYLQIGGDSAFAYDAALYYAWANYRFSDAVQFKAGIFDLATTRHTMSDDGAQHFVDRPVMDAVMGLGTGLGVRFWGQCADKRIEYFLDVVNSTSDGEFAALGRTITNDPAELDGNPAIAAKLLWHALGENPSADFLGDSDIEFHESPALDFCFHYVFNDDQGDVFTTRLPYPRAARLGMGGYGLTTTNGTQINQFGTDVGFKWQGFSLLGEYALRLVDPRRAFRTPFTPLSVLTGETSTVAQHGALVSAGYFLPIPGLEKQLEVVARVGGISTLAEGQEGTWEYAAGVNYYLKGHNAKLQADVTKIYEVPISSPYSSLANVNDDALVFRVQWQIAF